MPAITQTITAAQVDAKSPIDELLMQAIRQDIYDLDGAISAAGAFDYQFKLNGRLRSLKPQGLSFVARRRVDGMMLSKATTLTACRAVLERPGKSGTLELDVRRYLSPNVGITGVEHLYSDTISSIGRVGASLNTQSVARSTSQISTQSIARWKSTLNVQSIIKLGAGDSEFEDDGGYTNLVRINLSGTVDSDWVVGDYVTLSSCSNAANDGNFAIVGINLDGGNNVVIQNAAAVQQDTTTGTCDLGAWKFTYTNPVSSEFAATETVTLAAHTDPLNNGAFTIYAINQTGNNIIVKNATMVAQAGVAGNANNNRWVYSLSASAAADYVVGEYALTAAHTSGANDGTLRITAVNSGGNNVVLYNASGVAQGGASGTINTNRWVYVLPTDPSADISVGHYFWTRDATSAANRGEFIVKEVNRSAGTNLVVANNSGVTQAGSGGSLFSSRVKVKFAADQSSYITTASRLLFFGLSPDLDSLTSDGEYDALEINRGGGANYNAVVLMPYANECGACGRLALESKSIFDTRPSIAVSLLNGQWCQISSNAVLNATQAVVPASTRLMLDILQIPSGDARDLTVQLL